MRDSAEARRALGVGGREQVEGEAGLEEAERGDGAGPLQQGARELGAGGVAIGVNDAAGVVAALAAQVEFARIATPGMTSDTCPLPSTTKASFTPGKLLIWSRFALATLPPTAGHLV